MQTGYTRGSQSALPHWSVRSLVIGAAFLITLAAAGIIDADAIVRYFRAGTGSSDVMLEYGAIATMVAAAAFLAMGLSISDDDWHHET
jgi:hypothetical protein